MRFPCRLATGGRHAAPHIGPAGRVRQCRRWRENSGEQERNPPDSGEIPSQSHWGFAQSRSPTAGFQHGMPFCARSSDGWRIGQEWRSWNGRALGIRLNVWAKSRLESRLQARKGCPTRVGATFISMGGPQGHGGSLESHAEEPGLEARRRPGGPPRHTQPLPPVAAPSEAGLSLGGVRRRPGQPTPR